MQLKIHLSGLIALIVTGLIVGCATNINANSKSRSSYRKSTLPKVTPRVIPVGTEDNWRYLGTTQNNTLSDEINESSIQTDKTLNRYQDRKTIIDTANFNYNGLTPKYKYSLSWWRIDCNQKQYQIDVSSIYDEYGKLLKNYELDSTSWSTISNGSIAQLQYNYVCKGINREIGY